MIEKENNTLSTLLDEHLVSPYQDNLSTLHSGNKKSWLGTIREKVNNLVSKQTEIEHCNARIKKNTIAQDASEFMLLIGGFVSFFPTIIFITYYLKSLFELTGLGYLLEVDNKSLMSYVVTFLWIVISVGISLSAITTIGFFISSWINKGKIFNRKKIQLVTKKEIIVNEMNQQYNELQAFFTPDIKQKIIDYFANHFPGIRHEKAYIYHQSYHILQNCFSKNPVDYKVVIANIESLYYFIEETHPQDISDEHKILFDKIRSLI